MKEHTSDYRVHLGALHRKLGRDVGLAAETELVSLCPDCEEGVVPPVDEAYGLKSMVDKDLLQQPDIRPAPTLIANKRGKCRLRSLPDPKATVKWHPNPLPVDQLGDAGKRMDH